MSDIRLTAAVIGIIALLLECGSIPGAYGSIGLFFTLALSLALTLIVQWLQRIDARRAIEDGWPLASSAVSQAQGGW
jgi:hypothetical protein